MLGIKISKNIDKCDYVTEIPEKTEYNKGVKRKTQYKKQNTNNRKEIIKMTKFYICEHCGNVVEKIVDKRVPVVCCGEKMKELVPGTVEASHEKHIPVVEVNDSTVSVAVGSVEHPMTNEHSIEWIYLETDKGAHRKDLKPGDAPAASFVLAGEKPIAVYAYCNLHGLWKAEV